MDDAQAQYYEETYRALGLFVIRFSELLEALQEATLECMTQGAKQRLLGYAALSDRTAEPIQRSFFAVFFQRWASSLTDEDKAILSQIGKEIRSLMEVRNRLMHDAWMRYAKRGDPTPRPLWKVRYRAHGKGLAIDETSHPPDQLNNLSAQANRLAQLVISTSFGLGENGPALSERMEIVTDLKGKEVRFKKNTPPPFTDDPP